MGGVPNSKGHHQPLRDELTQLPEGTEDRNARPPARGRGPRLLGSPGTAFEDPLAQRLGSSAQPRATSAIVWTAASSILAPATATGFRNLCRDQRWSDRVLVADDEYVVVRAERESTWSAESFRGFATPQGVTTAVEMVHIWRLVDSKIVEHWAVRDDLALMMQLRVVESG